MLLALLAGAAPAAAAQTREATLAERYVRARAADIAGDSGTANREMARLLAEDAGNAAIAQRAFRQALLAGDRPLALRAGRTLAAQGTPPPDAPLLFAVDAIDRRDWPAARAALDRLEAGKLFAFLAPLLRGWIAFGTGDRDAAKVLDAAQANALAAAYLPAQRALLLLAAGRTDEGLAAMRSLPGAGTRVKLLTAAALQKAGREREAALTLDGDDPALAIGRARLAAHAPIGIAVATAAEGTGELLTQVALDFDRQQIAPVALALARLATFAAPGNGGAWIEVATLLGRAHQPEQALAALDRVRADDPYAGAGATLRVALLVDKGDAAAALATAGAAAGRPGAGVAEWSRLGDVSLSLDKPGDAAAAYLRALQLGEAQRRPDLWQLWLQRGDALEQAGNWPAAHDALRHAYALAPNEPIVLNHLGYSQLSRREDVAGSMRMIEQASRLRPDDPAITDSLGWANYVRGSYGRAVPLLERAAAGDPAEPTINEHLGDAYWSSGREREARFAWRAALVTADATEATRLRSKLAAGLTATTVAP